MIPIRSKTASRIQVFCSSSIRKRRIPSSLCVAASSLTRIHSRRRQLVTSTFAIVLRTLRSSISIFFNQIKNAVFETRVHLTCSPRGVGLLRGCPHGCLPQSRFPDDNGTRDAPPIGVSSALALSFAALSIGGVWSRVLYGTRSTLRAPQLFFRL